MVVKVSRGPRVGRLRRSLIIVAGRWRIRLSLVRCRFGFDRTSPGTFRLGTGLLFITGIRRNAPRVPLDGSEGAG